MSKAFDRQVGGDHYKHMKIQPMQYAEANKLTAGEHSVVKYVSRHRFKDGKKDLLKAIHCLELLLELHYPEGEEDDNED